MATPFMVELGLSDIGRTLISMDFDALGAVKQTVSLVYTARLRDLNWQNSRLLQLPDELLLKIGELMLVDNKPTTTTFMPRHLGEDRNRTALLRTCSQLRSKLFPVFLKRNTFLIHTKSLEAAKDRVCKLVSVNRSVDSSCFARIFVVARDHAALMENTVQEAAELATETEIAAFGGVQNPPVVIFLLYWRGVTLRCIQVGSDGWSGLRYGDLGEAGRALSAREVSFVRLLEPPRRCLRHEDKLTPE